MGGFRATSMLSAVAVAVLALVLVANSAHAAPNPLRSRELEVRAVQWRRQQWPRLVRRLDFGGIDENIAGMEKNLTDILNILGDSLGEEVPNDPFGGLADLLNLLNGGSDDASDAGTDGIEGSAGHGDGDDASGSESDNDGGFSLDLSDLLGDAFGGDPIKGFKCAGMLFGTFNKFASPDSKCAFMKDEVANMIMSDEEEDGKLFEKLGGGGASDLAQLGLEEVGAKQALALAEMVDSMLGTYCQSGCGEEVVEAVRELEQAGCIPDNLGITADYVAIGQEMMCLKKDAHTYCASSFLAAYQHFNHTLTRADAECDVEVLAVGSGLPCSDTCAAEMHAVETDMGCCLGSARDLYARIEDPEATRAKMQALLGKNNITIPASMELFDLFAANDEDALCGQRPVAPCTGVGAAAGRDGLGQEGGPSSTGKTVGIVLLVVGSLAMTYFVVGALVKRYHGARGAEQLPHIDTFRGLCGGGGGASGHTRLDSAFDLADDYDDDEVLKF